MAHRLCRVLSPAVAALSAFLVLLSLPAVASSAQSAVSRITQAVDDSRTIPLPGNVHPLAIAGYDHGEADPSSSTGRIQLVLKRSAGQQMALNQYLADLQNRDSASYHKWLTPTQFGTAFGISDSDLAIIVRWLQSHGFAVDSVSPARNIVEFSGTFAQIQSAFHTSIHTLSVGGKAHLANISNPSIPVALQPVVAGVGPLNDFHPTPLNQPAAPATYDASTKSIKPQFTLFDNTTPVLYTDPADAATIYDTPNSTLNPNYSGTTYDGTGINLGIVGDSNVSLADITNYRVAFLNETAANANIPTVVVDGNDPGLNGDEPEGLLDNGTAKTIPMDSSSGSIGSIAIGDVNNDGVPDVVAVFLNQLSQNSTNITVETYLGTGTGSFNSPTAAGTQTVSIAAQVQIPYNTGISLGDLNKDGKLDLAVDLEEQTSFSAGEVVATIALGNGDGSFAPINVTNPITLPVSGGFFLLFNTIGVQIADLNNDGNPDLAMDQNGTLYVALGSGSGTFTSTVQTNGIGESLQILYADLNGDGIPDFVQNANDLNVWIGKGDGTFARPIDVNTYVIDPGGAQALAVADFTGDGNVDIAQMGAEYNQISLFAGNGKGAFYGAPLLTSTTDATFDAAQLSIEAAADIAGNGLTDPIFVDIFGSSPYIVSGLSDGKGNFTYTTALAAAAIPNFAYLEPIQADFNGDGKQDLLIAGSDKSLSVALSNGDGTFQAPVKLSLPALDCDVNYAATGDLTGDGHTDIVVTYPGDASCGGSDSTPSGYFVALGKGDGTFATPVFTGSGNELYSAAIADINLDGIQDLILNDEPLSGNGTFAINLLTGNGDGTFSSGTSVYTNFVVTQVIAGDYNQDAKPDLILFSEGEATDLANSGSLDTGGIILLPSNGDGTFDSSNQLGTGHWFVNGVLADVNHDGIPDIVTALYHSAAAPTTYFGLATLLGIGNGGFAPPINTLETQNSTFVAAGNFVNDNSTGVLVETAVGAAFFEGQGGSSLALTTSASSIAFGQPETLTATLAASIAGHGKPTGTVSFYDGTTLLGTATISGSTAIYSATALAVGSHSITAVYSGDANFNPNTSSASTIAVTALAPAFTLASTPASLTVSVGQQGVATLTLAANATFNGAINLTCSGLPANSSCAVNPAQVTLTGGSTSQVSLLIGTTTSASATSAPKDVSRRIPFTGYAGGGIALTAMLFCFGRSRRLPSVFTSMLALVVLALAAAGLSGCGGGNGVKTAAKGTYTVTVTATPSGSAAAAQTATISVTLQ